MSRGRRSRPGSRPLRERSRSRERQSRNRGRSSREENICSSNPESERVRSLNDVRLLKAVWRHGLHERSTDTEWGKMISELRDERISLSGLKVRVKRFLNMFMNGNSNYLFQNSPDRDSGLRALTEMEKDFNRRNQSSSQSSNLECGGSQSSNVSQSPNVELRVLGSSPTSHPSDGPGSSQADSMERVRLPNMELSTKRAQSDQLQKEGGSKKVKPTERGMEKENVQRGSSQSGDAAVAVERSQVATTPADTTIESEVIPVNGSSVVEAFNQRLIVLESQTISADRNIKLEKIAPMQEINHILAVIPEFTELIPVIENIKSERFFVNDISELEVDLHAATTPFDENINMEMILLNERSESEVLSLPLLENEGSQTEMIVSVQENFPVAANALQEYLPAAAIVSVQKNPPVEANALQEYLPAAAIVPVQENLPVAANVLQEYLPAAAIVPVQENPPVEANALQEHLPAAAIVLAQENILVTVNNARPMEMQLINGELCETLVASIPVQDSSHALATAMERTVEMKLEHETCLKEMEKKQEACLKQMEFDYQEKDREQHALWKEKEMEYKKEIQCKQRETESRCMIDKLTRMKMVEEIEMAKILRKAALLRERKQLLDIGISRDEIDAILPLTK